MSTKIHLDSNPSFQGVFETLERGKTGVSFLGSRCVYLERGTYALLDEIILHVMNRVKSYPDFDETERIFGKKLVVLIDRFYSESKVAAKKSNLITRLFFMVSEFWIKNIKDCGYGVRFRWWREKKFPKLYTKTQFEKVFSFHPIWPADDNSYGFPKRWLSSTINITLRNLSPQPCS